MTDDGTLTMEKLLAAMELVKSADYKFPIGPGRLPEVDGYIPRHHLWFGPHAYVSDYLPDEQPRKLTRWERFRVWVEDLADRAEIYYRYPRVKRTEPGPAYLVGRDLYVPRRMAAAIRMTEVS